MESQNSVKSTYKYSNEETSQENVIKLILENLIRRYSRERIIDEINFVASKNENEIILKEKKPLDSKDIIAVIYKTVGSIKLYKSILEISQQFYETPKKNKSKPQNKMKNEKFITMKKTSPHFSTEEQNPNPQIIKKIKPIKNNTNNNDYDMVDKKDNIGEKINKDNNIISINEDEETSLELKKIEKGKRRKKLTKPVFASCNENSSDMYQNEEKKFKKKLGFHYSLNEENFYKFKVKDIYSDSASFICDDPLCKAFGIFSTENKSFKLVREHTKTSNEHCYNKEMTPKDINVLSYMKGRKIYDMQLTKVQ